MSEKKKRVYAPISDDELSEVLNKHMDWLAFGDPWGERAFLERRNLAGRDLEKEYLKKAWLLKANLKRASLRDAHLEWANIWRANLEGAELWGAHLKGAGLGIAHLEKAELWGAHLEVAVLEGAHLEGAELRDAHLERANIWWANLKGAELWGAHLKGAVLGRVNLEGAVLEGAHLEGADFRGANLEEANVAYVKYDRNTTFRGVRVTNCFGSPRFRAFAMHQDFIEEMRGGKWWERFLVAFWNVIADCGRTPWLWIGWSVLFAVYFGLNYFWMEPGSFNVDAPGLPTDNPWTYIYYSVVTFTTLGFGDVTPTTLAAARWVMAEVILGYVMLGGLISIFATLITPRR